MSGAWAEKYKDRGQVVIACTLPSSHSRRHRQRAPRREGHESRLSDRVDSDHAIWRALNNEYWPALYIVDAQGRIDPPFRRGGVRAVGKIIQQLLSEAGQEAQNASWSR
jgi:hypothetical protein